MLIKALTLVEAFFIPFVHCRTMQKHQITIAIDGYSSSGKSTLAKDLAKALDYSYLDSGAMYRAVTLYFQQHSVDITNPHAVSEALENIEIIIPPARESFEIFLNGMDVSELIRSLEVSQLVSEVAAISPVRRYLVYQQQQAGKDGGIVMDGRDIGTVVFPNAELKIFVDSDIETRVLRRFQEIQLKSSAVTKDEVRANLKHRDHIDSTREDSPLQIADGARILNNTSMSRQEQLEEVLLWVKALIEEQ